MGDEKTNHHYVSRVHLKQFLDGNNTIYIYDKELGNFYPKQSTRKLFSEDSSNSRETDGIVDNNSLEDELNDLIENDFNKHFAVIKLLIQEKKNLEDAYNSLNFLALIGIVGEYRHPKFKGNLENTLNEVEDDVFSRIGGYAKKERITKYQNLNSYYEMAIGTIERMGQLQFQIVCLTDDNHFVIPDTSCFQVRGQLRKYVNPHVNEIIQIGIPLSDKIFVNCTSTLLIKDRPLMQILESPSQSSIDKINCNLINFAYKAVGCSDVNYLKQIVKMCNKRDSNSSI